MNTFFGWMKQHWFLAITGLGVVLVGAYFYFQTGETSEALTTKIQTKVVERGVLSIRVSGSGQIQADSQVDLKPVVAGDALEVTSVAVRNDQEVTKGQIIAILDNEDARRDVERSRLDVRRAEIQLKQKEELYPKETKDDKYERQLSDITVAQSRIALVEAQERLNDYTIRAPFDGIVTGLAVESGDTISQTSVLASVITKNMKVVITLNEVDASKVKIGNAAALSFDALPNESVLGTVTKLDTIGTAEQGVVSYGAEITLETQHSKLKPGMSVTADITVAEKQNVLLIPNAALTYESGKAWVRVASSRGETANTVSAEDRNGRGERREVTVGLTDNISTEIMSGLKEGDRVLIVPSVGVINGQANQSNTNQGGVFNLFRGGSNNRGTVNR